MQVLPNGYRRGCPKENSIQAKPTHPTNSEKAAAEPGHTHDTTAPKNVNNEAAQSDVAHKQEKGHEPDHDDKDGEPMETTWDEKAMQEGIEP